MTNDINWILLLVQVPSEPSRYRVAVWRQLRKTGAVPLQSGTWVVPNTAHFAAGVAAARTVCRDAGGSFTQLVVSGEDQESRDVLRDAFAAARQEEWQEFLADCGKFDREIDKEISIQKFTYAELEEEEQSLERLRRWYRELKKRDVLRLELADEADAALRHCTERLDEYAELVYAAGHEQAGA